MKKLMHDNDKLRAGVIGALMTSLVYAGNTQAELTFNVGAFTDYIDNGESVSNNHAVVQGGVEYAHPGGWFLGAQVSTLGGDGMGQEVAPFFGLAFPMGPLELEIGYEYFHYSEQDDADEGELFLGIGLGPVTASISHVVHADDSDAKGSTVYVIEGDYAFMPDTRVLAGLGYDDPNKESGVTFWMLGLARESGPGEISLTYAARDEAGAQSLFVAGYTISF
ncbi:TorF family putative porin [Ectothiorhodospira sp. PHS-1]|uniref:TorF family putative porin n=1 Tax=Ectothiorhodospira sp. PHS-1 TaxID=519989 RepID=UPI001FEDEFDB|nr:TorF family putative porin [Ectothiorhodospira sp. PHS-1]